MGTTADKLQNILNAKNAIRDKFNLPDDLPFGQYADNIDASGEEKKFRLCAEIYSSEVREASFIFDVEIHPYSINANGTTTLPIPTPRYRFEPKELTNNFHDRLFWLGKLINGFGIPQIKLGKFNGTDITIYDNATDTLLGYITGDRSKDTFSNIRNWSLNTAEWNRLMGGSYDDFRVHNVTIREDTPPVIQNYYKYREIHYDKSSGKYIYDAVVRDDNLTLPDIRLPMEVGWIYDPIAGIKVAQLYPNIVSPGLSFGSSVGDFYKCHEVGDGTWAGYKAVLKEIDEPVTVISDVIVVRGAPDEEFNGTYYKRRGFDGWVHAWAMEDNVHHIVYTDKAGWQMRNNDRAFYYGCERDIIDPSTCTYWVDMQQYNHVSSMIVTSGDSNTIKYYEFEETLTTGLTYGYGFTPEVGKNYDSEAMVRLELPTEKDEYDINADIDSLNEQLAMISGETETENNIYEIGDVNEEFENLNNELQEIIGE